jgi:hypothetical protein
MLIQLVLVILTHRGLMDPLVTAESAGMGYRVPTKSVQTTDGVSPPVLLASFQMGPLSFTWLFQVEKLPVQQHVVSVVDRTI